MKNSQIALALVGLMFLMSLATCTLLLRYTIAAHEYNDLSTRSEMARNTQNFMQQLLVKVIEYSKKDPAITPLVQWATNNAATTPPPAIK